MFKRTVAIDMKMSDLPVINFEFKSLAKKLSKWFRGIKERKIALTESHQDDQDQVQNIETTAKNIDDAQAVVASGGILASATAVTGINSTVGGSNLLGVLAGGAAVAAAAGGGGGGGGPAPVTYFPPVNIHAPHSNNFGINNVQPTTKTFLIGTAPLLVKSDWWLGDAVSVDLNRDGVDELIVLGSKSQPSTIANWSDSYIQILGFNTGKLAIETSRWLPGNSNRVLGAIGGKITGDFNGDGWTDIWIGPSTDMRHYGPAVVLFNQNGQSLRRVEVDIGDMWVHDVAIADFNGDGYDDIMPLGWGPAYRMLFGRADGGFDVISNGAQAAYGAGIAAADFLSNGTVTFIITDTETIGGSDTGLYTWGYDNGGFRLDRIATLPAERFNLPKWQNGQYDWDWIPHSIRVLAHDFDRDGDPDAIVFTTYYDNNIGGHSRSEVQFLKNNGQASFTDVTDNLLLDYNHRTSLGIAPRLLDINDDGLLDIWITGGDGDGPEDTSRVLLAHANGTFREIMGSALAQFRADVGGETSFVHYMEDAHGRDYVVGIEKYSYTGNNQVEFVAAPLGNYYSAGWIT